MKFNKFDIQGRPKRGPSVKNISVTEVKALLHASDVILSYHGYSPVLSVITIKFIKEFKGVTKTGEKIAGDASYSESFIRIEQGLNWQSMAITIIHEMIHCYIDFPYHETEANTSNLTNKLKKDILDVYNILVDGTFRRAGYFAHTKISYPPKEGEPDFYAEQWDGIYTIENKGKRFQKK